MPKSIFEDYEDDDYILSINEFNIGAMLPSVGIDELVTRPLNEEDEDYEQ